MGDVESSPDRRGGRSPEKKIVIIESEPEEEGQQFIGSPVTCDNKPSSPYELKVQRRNSQALSELGSSFEIMDPTYSLLEPASSPPPGITSEEEFCEDEMEDTMIQFPDLSKSMMLSCSGLPPRTIPFRSASFSQVDITSEGKYVRKSKSPITLMPTAFCLMNKNPGIGCMGPASTPVPRSDAKNDGDSMSPPLFEVKSCPLGSFCQLPTHYEKDGSETSTLMSLNDSRNSLMVSDIKENEAYCDFKEITTITENPSKSDVGAGELSSSTSDIEVQMLETETDPDFKGAEGCSDHKNEEADCDAERADETKRVNFTLGGDEEPLEIIRNLIPQKYSGDFSALAEPKAEIIRTEDSIGIADILSQQRISSSIIQSSGAGSTSSTSGGEAESDPEKGHFIRQSSGQSDGSDEILPLNASDQSCPSPVPPGITDESLQIDTSPLGISVPIMTPSAETVSASNLHSSPPLVNKKEIIRAHSVSTTRSLPRGRYNKRPLRGPYGEMLEAEMNKLIPVRTNRDLDHFEIFRESKSSSPNRSSNSHSNSPEGGSGPLLQSSIIASVGTGSLVGKKLMNVNPILMASMDDLNLTKSKHSNPRSRKISANLPVQTSHYSGDDNISPVIFHQRTASSPSQLLYTSTAPTTLEEVRPDPRLLDGSPRGHVLAEVVETEKSYVDSLRIITKKYMEPMKTSDLIDGGLVDEIFSQLPSIMWHHERLLAALQQRIVDDNQCVGDVLLDAFRQNSLLECYSLFVNNWKNAKGSLKMAIASKPALARFLEANARQHKGKLNLDSLLIMPIQRIPRYELMVKELLKYTEVVHEDHSRLILLLEMIKKFALHIDCASVDPNDNREVEIEGWSSGLGHLIRQDMVTASLNSNARKEKALFLFADSLVLAAIKRKGTRKPSSNLGGQGGSQWDGCKFKLVLKSQLTEIHSLHENYETLGLGASSSSCGLGASGGGSRTDRMLGASSYYSGSHEDIDDLKVVHRMMDLSSTLRYPHVVLDDVLRELYISLYSRHTENNGDPLEFEIRTNDSDCPEVLKLYFNSLDKKASWLESFQDTLGKYIRYGFGRLPQVQFVQALPIRKTRAGLQLSCAAPVCLHNKVSKTLEMSDVWVANSDGYVGQICILTLHPEPAITSCNGVCNSRITCIISVPPPTPGVQSASMSPNTAHASHQADDHHHHHHHNVHSLGYESEDETHKHRAGHKSTEHWTVWLGTEDGGLHVYDCSDSVRVKKNRHKIQHTSPLIGIVYYDGRVFASLANGDVAVYSRNQNSKGWSIGDPSWVTIGSAITPVSKMLCVACTIWCCCGSQIKVYSDTGGMLELLQTIQLTIEGNEMPKGVMAIVPTEEHVWIALQGTSVIKCYNHRTYEPLEEINVGPEVSKMLAGCDDIIRQHKSACLRVTSLLIAPDKKLWIGTSAGVILTMSLIGERKIVPLSHGHTGQVRFLTCCTSRDSWTVITGGDGFEEFRSLPLLNNNSSTFSSMVTSLMGDSSNDTSGREDSTNHLLVWKIPKPL